MKKLTIINPRSKSIVLNEVSRAKAAEWLGVTPSAVNNSKAGIIQGYLVVDMAFPHWAIGYILSAREQELLGLTNTDTATHKDVCTCCGRTNSILAKYQLCTVCLGLDIDTLGTLRPAKLPILVTDGVNIYPSIKAAAIATGRKPMTAASAIYKCLMGKTKSYLGKSWAIALPPKEINDN